MNSSPLHPAQISILYTLRHTQSARFSALMQPTGLSSDAFKFHIRKLVERGWIIKTATGSYILTAAGKEFANNISVPARGLQKQPKLSVIVVVKRQNGANEEVEYLMQQRRRNPFFGFWSNIGGPVQWGEEAEHTGQRELLKQTGLCARCEVRAFYRKRDYAKGAANLLEDKLFIVLEALDVQGELSNDWPGGRNQWMTLNHLCAQPHYFASTFDIIKLTEASQNPPYASGEYHYPPETY